MSFFYSSTSNYSLYTIPAAWVLCLAPHVYASQLLPDKFDVRSPRQFVAKLEQDQSVDTATKNKIMRAEAAQQNGFENIALFAAAVTAGNMAGLPAKTLNALSFGYLVSRVAYTYIYITNETVSAANMRSAVFISGVGMIMTLFGMAGSKLQALL